MFMSADVVVKAVMIGLLLASIATWSTWLAKSVELWSCRRSLKSALTQLASEKSLAGASVHLAEQSHVVAALVSAAATELKLSNDIADKTGIKDRISSRLAEIVATTARRSRVGTGLLASIGATSPFIGLFGTVWGIMNSFIGISKSHTTNLAVVAPGIAEALLATALGLAAAIPAVVIYNLFSRQIANYRAMLADTSAEVLRLVSRDLDRSLPLRKGGPAAAAE